MPRYFHGRNILVKAPVFDRTQSPDYQSYNPSQSKKYVTHNAILVGISEDRKNFIVELKGFD